MFHVKQPLTSGDRPPRLAWPPLMEGSFRERLNRFTVLADLQRTTVRAHLANSGRLAELLVPGNRVWLSNAPYGGRRTTYDLVLAQYGDTLASVDARVPNRLMGVALEQRALAEFAAYPRFQREVAVGRHRVDFVLRAHDGSTLLLEVKSVTLVVDRVALFPDAPTARGRQHLELLSTAARSGQRGAVVFVVQRMDADMFSPNTTADPHFAGALRSAAESGVEVRAYRCEVSLDGIALVGSLPVCW